MVQNKLFMKDFIYLAEKGPFYYNVITSNLWETTKNQL